MAEWRKVLVSGSNAHVAAITASVMGTLENDAEVVFRRESTGRFFSSGSNFNVKYTSSDGGQLYLDNIALRTHNISASGIPDGLNNLSELMFWDPYVPSVADARGGLKATSSIRYSSATNTINFQNGTFSGSFVGDGSNLTGVIGTLAAPLQNSNGITSASVGTDFSWDGTEKVVMTIATASNGGLDFTDGGLHLVSSLAGDGLYFTSASDDNYSTMSVDLDTQSGLALTTGGKLKLSNSLPGSGLEYSTANSAMRVKLATDSGLSVGAGGLSLLSTLPGTGLDWATPGDYSELEIDTSYVVTSGTYITLNTGSSNLTLSATSATGSTSGYKAWVIDNPSFTYDLNTTLTGNFTFVNDLIVQGDFTVSGSLVTASIETENLNIADQFILLNSGSSTGDGGFVVQNGVTTGAYLFYDSESARWGVSAATQTLTDNTHNVNDTNHAAFVTVQISNDSESTILSSTPLFGTNDTDRQGQLIITTAAATNESSIYIYS